MKISRDINGNKILSIQNTDLDGRQGFSIQTLGNLPKTHRTGICAETVSEILAYVENYGTFRQIEAVKHLQIKGE